MRPKAERTDASPFPEHRSGEGLAVSGGSRVFGIIGWPVAHSLSPAMHNRAFQVTGYPGVYVPFPVEPEKVAEAVAGIRALGLGGVNVTVPHKRSVMPCLDEISADAQRIGAVNTIVNRDGRLVGHNTDGAGFLRSLTEELGVHPRGASVVMLGAGGGARAIAVALLGAGAGSLTIANRTLATAEALAADLSRWYGAGDGDGAGSSGRVREPLALDDMRLEEAVRQADLLIHTTVWGMAPHDDVPPLISPSWLNPGTVVCDIVYAPAETSLLRAARERGCRVLPGLGMLLFQGAIAFEMWTGQPAPVAAMRHVLEQHVSSR